MRVPGIGALYALPSGANPTPIPFAIILDVTLDLKIKTVELHGQWTYALDVAKFAAGAALKAKFKDFRADIFNMVTPGGATTTGSVLPVTGEAWTIPTTPFQVTVAQAATFQEDGGVLNYTQGKYMTRVASAPTTGQYSVTAGGIYTFAAADVGNNLSIVYTYSSASVGKTVTVTNTTMGPSVPYAVRVWEVFPISGVLKPVGWKFPAVHFDNLGWGLKSEDWAEQSVNGIVAQDPASQNVMTYYVGD
jgi:hypothetical protein